MYGLGLTLPSPLHVINFQYFVEHPATPEKRRNETLFYLKDVFYEIHFSAAKSETIPSV